MYYKDILSQDFSDSIGDQLKYKRLELGVSQKELANSFGVSRDTIMRMENNQHISIGLKIEIIKKLDIVPTDYYTYRLCNDFGSYLKEKRIEMGLTQNELANVLGVARKTIRFWEKEYSYPTPENYVALLKLFSDEN